MAGTTEESRWPAEAAIAGTKLTATRRIPSCKRRMPVYRAGRAFRDDTRTNRSRVLRAFARADGFEHCAKRRLDQHRTERCRRVARRAVAYEPRTGRDDLGKQLARLVAARHERDSAR